MELGKMLGLAGASGWQDELGRWLEEARIAFGVNSAEVVFGTAFFLIVSTLLLHAWASRRKVNQEYQKRKLQVERRQARSSRLEGGSGSYMGGALKDQVEEAARKALEAQGESLKELIEEQEKLIAGHVEGLECFLAEQLKAQRQEMEKLIAEQVEALEEQLKAQVQRLEKTVIRELAEHMETQEAFSAQQLKMQQKKREALARELPLGDRGALDESFVQQLKTQQLRMQQQELKMFITEQFIDHRDYLNKTLENTLRKQEKKLEIFTVEQIAEHGEALGWFTVQQLKAQEQLIEGAAAEKVLRFINKQREAMEAYVDARMNTFEARFLHLERIKGRISPLGVEKAVIMDMMPERKLQFEMIPQSCWDRNARNALTREEWDLIRHKVYEKEGMNCHICHDFQIYLEAHEVWEFDEEHRIQKLVDIVGICNNCHKTIHYGRTSKHGGDQKAKLWFMYVNQSNEAYFRNSLHDAWERLERLNKITEWELDLSYVGQFGIDCPEQYRGNQELDKKERGNKK